MCRMVKLHLLSPELATLISQTIWERRALLFPSAPPLATYPGSFAWGPLSLCPAFRSKDKFAKTNHAIPTSGTLEK